MTTTIENKTDSTGKYLGTMRVIRSDAEKVHGRYIVPTSAKTQWVHTWADFKAAGGNLCFNEDQTEIELLLPEPYKFSIQFGKEADNGLDPKVSAEQMLIFATQLETGVDPLQVAQQIRGAGG